MTTTRKSLIHSWWIPLIILPAVTLVFVAALTSNHAEEEALCVKAVEAILHSTDLVEVTRAGIILRETNCSLRRHLDREL